MVFPGGFVVTIVINDPECSAPMALSFIYHKATTIGVSVINQIKVWSGCACSFIAGDDTYIIWMLGVGILHRHKHCMTTARLLKRVRMFGHLSGHHKCEIYVLSVWYQLTIILSTH